MNRYRTTGPWVRNKNRHKDGYYDVGPADQVQHVCRVRYAADAQLVAAAPEMLELLERARQVIIESELVQKIDDVLKKVKEEL